MTKTGRVAEIEQTYPPAFCANPSRRCAEPWHSGRQLVTVSGRRGEVRVKAQITEDVRKGLCFLPMHWGKILGSNLVRANNLTNNAG
jgi:ferredoxin-nitrate reductase